MNKLTLVSSATCPYVQRAIIALKEKGSTFDVAYVDLQNKPDWFLAISPLGKVPVLRVDRPDNIQTSIFESTVIVEFIEETEPGPNLHPSDPLAKAEHRAWMEFGSVLLPETYRVWMAKDEAAYRTARDTVAGKLARLEEKLDAGPYFAGEAFSCVDTVFAPIFRAVDATEAMSPIGLLEDFPKVRAWSRALAERQSVREAVPADYIEIFTTRLNLKDSYFMQAAA